MRSPIFEPAPLILFVFGDSVAERNASLIIEEGKTVNLDNRWRVRYERSHHDNLMYHNHVYLKDNLMAIINRDGSPSHDSDWSQIPKYILDMMRKKKLLEGQFGENAGLISTEIWQIPTTVIDSAHAMIGRDKKMSRLLRLVGYNRFF